MLQEWAYGSGVTDAVFSVWIGARRTAGASGAAGGLYNFSYIDGSALYGQYVPPWTAGEPNNIGGVEGVMAGVNAHACPLHILVSLLPYQCTCSRRLLRWWTSTH